MVHEFLLVDFEKKDKKPLEKIREITTNVLLDNLHQVFSRIFLVDTLENDETLV